MLIEFARPVEMMDAGRAIRFEAGERRGDLPEPIARSLVEGGYAVALDVPALPARRRRK